MITLSKHVPRPLAGITFTLALAGAGCGVAVDPGEHDGTRAEAPDLRPDLPDYVPDEDGIDRFHAAEGVLRRSKARGTADGGNADGVHGCVEGRYDHYEHGGNERSTQLHVIGIYTHAEGSLDAPHASGPVDVQVNRAGKSVLVLSAYEPVEWNIQVADGATLEGVVVSGYYEQRVNAPEGVPVAYYSYEQDGEIFGDIAYQWPSFRTTDLVDAAELITDLELTSFRGCNASASFQIDEPGELRPPHDVSPSEEPHIIPGCEALAAESSYCMVMETGLVQMVGLDSGTTCGAVPTEIEDLGEASLGWLGDHVYMCMRERGLARVSVVDGSVDIASVPCEGVTVQDGGLVALVWFDGDEYAAAPWYVARFASFEDAVRREPEQVYEMAPYASRMAAHGDTLYFAWHSTNTIEVAELADGAEFQSLPLQDFDNWIMGMDVTDDGRLVLGSWSDAGGLHVFDASTGAFQGKLDSAFSDTLISGIDCVSGGAAE